MDPLEVRLIYAGGQADGGQLDAAHLGRSLVGFASLVEAMHNLVSPDAAPVVVRVRATDEGSVEVLLVLEHLLEDAVRLGSSDTAAAMANYAQIFSSIAAAIAAARWWMRGSGTLSRRTDGSHVVVDEDGVEHVIPAHIVRVIRSSRFREFFRDWFAPLIAGVSDHIAARSEPQEIPDVVVDAEAAGMINELSDAGDSDIDEFRNLTTLEVRTVAFKTGEKWRVQILGGGSAWVRITDQEFMDRVVSGAEAFAEGDRLYVDLDTRRTTSEEGMTRVEHVVTKVHDHRHLPKQGHIDGDAA